MVLFVAFSSFQFSVASWKHETRLIVVVAAAEQIAMAFFSLSLSRGIELGQGRAIIDALWLFVCECVCVFSSLPTGI